MKWKSCILENHGGPVLWLHVRYAKYWRQSWHLTDYAISSTVDVYGKYYVCWHAFIKDLKMNCIHSKKSYSPCRFRVYLAANQFAHVNMLLSVSPVSVGSIVSVLNTGNALDCIFCQQQQKIYNIITLLSLNISVENTNKQTMVCMKKRTNIMSYLCCNKTSVLSSNDLPNRSQ